MTTLAIPTEHDEQAGFVGDVKARYQHRRDFYPELFYSVPNGFWAAGKGNAKFALIAKYKAEGMRPGVADVMYDQPRGGFTKFVCEMKRRDRRNEKNGGLSDDQMAYLNAARKVGAFVCVCYTADEAVQCFDNYMAMEAE